MPLEPRQKELAAIGASIGSNCRPCIEHHLGAGRQAGLTEAELERAVTRARVVRDEAIELLAARVDELLGRGTVPPAPAHPVAASDADELVALGAAVGANAHSLLRLHIGAALEAGLNSGQVRSALKMAQYVQQKAAEITTQKAADIVSSLVGTPAQPA